MTPAAESDDAESESTFAGPRDPARRHLLLLKMSPADQARKLRARIGDGVGSGAARALTPAAAATLSQRGRRRAAGGP